MNEPLITRRSDAHPEGHRRFFVPLARAADGAPRERAALLRGFGASLARYVSGVLVPVAHRTRG